MLGYPWLSSGLPDDGGYMSIYLLPDVTTPTVTAIGGIALLYTGNALGWPVLLLGLLVYLGVEYNTAE